ncbi:MAG: universal stress protein [Nocardioidaceae bacterium]|nr:universal stress protein [Nocardioidaceae bacterium]
MTDLATHPHSSSAAVTAHAVVVGTDGSERSRGAVRWAAHEARHQGLALRVFIALDDFVVPGAYLPSNVLLEDADATEQLVLDDPELAAAAQDGVDVAAVTVSGTPPQVLLDAAENARMLVVGCRGAGGFSRLVMGSTSTTLAGHAPLPVVVVPDSWHPRADAPGSVVLGVDLHAPVKESIEFAMRHAAATGVRLRAVAVWDTGQARLLDPEERRSAFASAHDSGLAHLGVILRPWVKAHPGVEVRPEMVMGHPAGTLVEVAGEVGAGLLVVGRPRTTSVLGFPLGSTANAVLHHSGRPTAVVPPVA